jgi:hypothetical protein
LLSKCGIKLINSGISSVVHITGGLFYRMRDAVIPVIQIQQFHFMIGISYDINIDKLAVAAQHRGDLNWHCLTAARMKKDSRCVRNSAGKILLFEKRFITFAIPIKGNGFVAQLNRASDYESEGFWFESRRGHHIGLASIIGSQSFFYPLSIHSQLAY